MGGDVGCRRGVMGVWEGVGSGTSWSSIPVCTPVGLPLPVAPLRGLEGVTTTTGKVSRGVPRPTTRRSRR